VYLVSIFKRRSDDISRSYLTLCVISSNTIPTDVINFSQSIQVREPVRVLVRREGGTNASQESTSSGNLRHYYLYLAGNQNTEVNQAKEFKLEALADLLLEYPLWQAIIHVGAQSTLDAVTSKLNSRQMENLSLVGSFFSFRIKLCIEIGLFP
jgi:translation initiation factor 4A